MAKLRFEECENCKDWNGNRLHCANVCGKPYDAWDEFNRLKDLEEQGLLIQLPCKLGRKLYDIIEFAEGHESPDIYVIDASRIEISKDKAGFLYCIDDCDYREEDFGKTLFKSEEAATKAIREMGWIL